MTCDDQTAVECYNNYRSKHYKMISFFTLYSDTDRDVSDQIGKLSLHPQSLGNDSGAFPDASKMSNLHFLGLCRPFMPGTDGFCCSGLEESIEKRQGLAYNQNGGVLCRAMENSKKNTKNSSHFSV